MCSKVREKGFEIRSHDGQCTNTKAVHVRLNAMRVLFTCVRAYLRYTFVGVDVAACTGADVRRNKRDCAERHAVDSEEFLSSGQNHKALILALKFLLGVCILVCVSVCMSVFVFLYFLFTYASVETPNQRRKFTPRTITRTYSRRVIRPLTHTLTSHAACCACTAKRPSTHAQSLAPQTSLPIVPCCTAPLLRDNTCAPASYER